MVGAERSALFLLDAPRSELFTKVAVGSEELRVKIDDDSSLVVQSFQQKAVLKSDAELCVPVVLETEDKHTAPVGVIVAINKFNGKPFDDDDVRQCSSFARILGAVIANNLQDRSELLMDKVFLVPALPAKNKTLIKKRPVAKLPKEWLAYEHLELLRRQPVHPPAVQIPDERAQQEKQQQQQQQQASAPASSTQPAQNNAPAAVATETKTEEQEKKKGRKRASTEDDQPSHAAAGAGEFSHFKIPRFVFNDGGANK
jgi:hypothetical protein